LAEHTKGVKETRNRLMKTDQVMGMPLAEIAKKYRVTMPELRKGLSDAQKAGVLQAIEEGIFTDIMPKALAVLESHLDRGESLKAVEIAMALFGVLKSSVAKKTFEVSMPADNRAVGIIALDEIRQERTINATQLERRDLRPAIDHPGGEDPPRDLPGLGRE
jgi:hypothetical protein